MPRPDGRGFFMPKFLSAAKFCSQSLDNLRFKNDNLIIRSQITDFIHIKLDHKRRFDYVRIRKMRVGRSKTQGGRL